MTGRFAIQANGITQAGASFGNNPVYRLIVNDELENVVEAISLGLSSDSIAVCI
jgi:hypothetical protein